MPEKWVNTRTGNSKSSTGEASPWTSSTLSFRGLVLPALEQSAEVHDGLLLGAEFTLPMLFLFR